MKKILLISLLLWAHAAQAESFLHIGTPEEQALTQASSKGQVLLLDMKLIECSPSATKASENGEESLLCGEDAANVVYHGKDTMREGTERLFTETRPVTLSFTRPQVMFGKKAYRIQAVQESTQLSTQTQVKLSLSKVIDKHVLASVVVTEDRFSLAEVMAYHEGQSFVNPTPIPFRRMMTGRQKFKIGETHNITGDLWVELPPEENEKTLSGERNRLFLRLTIK